MNYELQFRQSFAKLRQKLGRNYAREGRIKKCVTWRRGRGIYRGGGAAPKGWPAKEVLLLIMVVTPLHALHGGNPLINMR
jgi:hypothetical protein